MKSIYKQWTFLYRSINKHITSFIVLLLVEVLESCVMKVVTEANAKWESYLGTIQSITFGSLATDFLSFTILYNYIVPISLYVTIGKNHVFVILSSP